MNIQRGTRAIHWDYFLALEDDLMKLSRFVDFSGNDETYSIEIARLLLTAASETDVVLKAICRTADPASRAQSITAYFPIVTREHPGIINLEVVLTRYGVTLTPWTGWTSATPPLWWTANNKIKHERSDHFDAANLKHCLNAAAGLFAAVLYLYRAEAEAGLLEPVPALFRIPNIASNAMNAHPPRYYFRLP